VAAPAVSAAYPAASQRASTAVLRTRSRTTSRHTLQATLQTTASRPGQTYPIKVLCAREYNNYRFSIPTENTVSDSVALMSEQILQDLAAKGTTVPKRVSTCCFPAMFESATVADWGAQNSNHPPLLLMEAQADLTESQARVGEVPGAAQNLGIYEKLEQQTAVIRNQAQRIEDLHRRYKQEESLMNREIEEMQQTLASLHHEITARNPQDGGGR
jgi:septin family protein